MEIGHRVRTNRRRPGALFAAIGMALYLVVAQASDQAVTWTDLVNVTANGDVLQKTSGCDGCEDAGAASQAGITQGDGYVEFTVGETNTFWVGGLRQADSQMHAGLANDVTSIAAIDFAWRFNGAGSADVLESGQYQSGGDTPYAAGDVFRVGVVGGKIQYSRNGIVLRESQTAVPQYPLQLDVSLESLGAT